MGTPLADGFEILERIKDGIIALDQHWNFTYINEKASRLLFRSRTDLVGKNVWDEFPEAVHLPFYEHYHEAVFKQVPVAFEAYFPPLNTWFDVRAYPSLNGLSIYFQDVTKTRLELKQWEEHYLELEEIFHLISENSQDIISIISPEGRTEYVSPSIRTLLGYEPEEVIGLIRYDFWHPDDVKEFQNISLSSNPDQSILVRRVRHKSGQYVWIETSTKIKRNEHGDMIHAIGISRDITDRKAAEEELRKTKDRLQSLVQNNADAIWVIDLEDRVLEINPAFETMFDWSAEEVIGKKLPIIPDIMKERFQDIHQTVKAGTSIAGLETIRQRRDGSLLDVSATLSPIVDSTGQVIAITGICRDITPRKQAEGTLKAQTQQLMSFIENNEDAILVLDFKGIIQHANKSFEQMFGWTKQEIVGIGVYDLPTIPAEYIEEVSTYFEEVKKGKSIFGIETVRARKDGAMLNIMLTLSPIHDENGTIDGWSATIRDITERKKAQEMLQYTEKLSVAGQLAAGIAHEIRNPITAIKGFVQLMESGIGEKKEYLEIISSEIKRIEQILSELLMLAKPQASKFERKDIRILMDQVVTLLDTQAILNDVEIVTEFESANTQAWIQCDENQLKQVFINYIKNAIEAMPSGGKLVIQIRKIDEEKIMIGFTDHGEGMSEEVLSKLGQPFYTTKEKGTGLGFMISKQIIENHRGEVRIRSKVNKGTTIQVVLPLEQEARV